MGIGKRVPTFSEGGYELPVYDYATPPEIATGEPVRHSVAIVGGGLSGLTLAALLGSYGVPCVLLDEDDTVGVLGASSRGICYAQPTLELFETLGFSSSVIEAGATWSTGRVYTRDRELFSFELEKAQGSDFPPFVNIQQFYVEGLLVEAVDRYPVVDLRWRSRVTGIEQDDAGVRLTVECPDGSYQLLADHVVDATGASSPIREALSVEVTEERLPGRWVISDIQFADPRPSERYAWIDATFNEGRAVWLHKMADDVWRVDFQMTPDSDPAEIESAAAVDARIRGMFGQDIDYKSVWIGSFQTRTTMVDRMSVGRVHLCGDAAHVVPPFGARGGNTGVQDANNLAWKLAMVVRGEAPTRLLDSYAAERMPIAERNRTVTRRSARFMQPRSDTEASLRDAVLAMAGDDPFLRSFVNTGRMAHPDRYASSEWIASTGGSRLNHSATVRRGETSTSVPELLRETGARLAVLMFEADPSTGAEVVSVASDGPVVCYAIDAEASGTFGPVGEDATPKAGDLWVIRPDGMIVGIARTAAEVRMLIDGALGRADLPRDPAAHHEVDYGPFAAADAFYEALIAAHEGRSAEESARLNAALVVALTGAVADPAALRGCLERAESSLA